MNDVLRKVDLKKKTARKNAEYKKCNNRNKN